MQRLLAFANGRSQKVQQVANQPAFGSFFDAVTHGFEDAVLNVVAHAQAVASTLFNSRGSRLTTLFHTAIEG